MQETKQFASNFERWIAQALPEHSPSRIVLRDMDTAGIVISGLTPSRNTPLLTVTPDASITETVYQDIVSLTSIFDTRRRVQYLPQVEHLRQSWTAENEAARCSVLQQILNEEADVVVSSLGGVLDQIIPPDAFHKQALTIQSGREDLPPRRLAEYLESTDYDNEIEVHAPGEFAVRGGIVDVFSPLYEMPVRVEYFGDMIDTLRFFDPGTQRSQEYVEAIQLIPRGTALLSSDEPDAASIFSYLSDDVNLLIFSPQKCHEHLVEFASEAETTRWGEIQQSYSQQIIEIVEDLPGSTEHSYLDPLTFYPSVKNVKEALTRFPSESGPEAVQLYYNQLGDLLQDWREKGYLVAAFCDSEGEKQRFNDVVQKELELPDDHILYTADGLHNGTILPDASLVLLTATDIFGKRETTQRRFNWQYKSDHHSREELELEPGAYAVHASKGICIYHGIREVESKGVYQEVFDLEFAEGQRLYVPLEYAYLVSRYIGGKKKLPKLSKLGSAVWGRTRDAAESAAYDFAAELLRLEAVRKEAGGTRYEKITQWEESFAKSFPYEETEDQKQAIEEILHDMEKEEPMDRLLCGDVGYGKTEVAMRAAFRAVANGKQVAVLVPTTLLAQQHYLNFSERMGAYPVFIESLSRFQSTKDQNRILRQATEGNIDVLIGTHRLLQQDVEFGDLGLIIVDEEQRFGVKHKEQLKRLRTEVDILTMTATPIPRTLYLSLAGLRNLSTIMTPPADRLPVSTTVAAYDDKVIRNAILHELERQGQVFFLHNRVKTIEQRCRTLQRCVPEARIGIAHGQMAPHDLEEVMRDYLNDRLDVLVCTTIIQSGLDIPNANTILIEEANKYGLAELYQLRGRVGRYHHQAYCYLLLPHIEALPENARERLAAIRQYTHLGAGFKLALRDLEIRGAGNLLGTSQSGHIAAVGFELYCQLLEKSVAQLQNRASPEGQRIPVHLDFVLHGVRSASRTEKILAGLPEEYIPSPELRLQLYRRFNKVSTLEDAEACYAEIEDRFGALPEETKALLDTVWIRVAAAQSGATALYVRENMIHWHTKEKTPLTDARGRLPTLSSTASRDKLEEVKAFVKDIYQSAVPSDT